MVTHRSLMAPVLNGREFQRGRYDNDATQLLKCMNVEMRPKRIEFDYLPSNSKEAMDNDFDFFDSHLDSVKQ